MVILKGALMMDEKNITNGLLNVFNNGFWHFSNATGNKN